MKKLIGLLAAVVFLGGCASINSHSNYPPELWNPPESCHFGTAVKNGTVVKQDIQTCLEPVKRYVSVSIAEGSCTVFEDGNYWGMAVFQMCMTDKGYPDLGFVVHYGSGGS